MGAVRRRERRWGVWLMEVKTQTVAARRVSLREDRRKLGQRKRLSTLMCLKLKSALELIPVFLFHLFIISSLHIVLPSPINLGSFQGRSWTQVPETLKGWRRQS